VPRMSQGGRIFYIGAGTSGRLGVVDASECPPTFGVPADWVQGIIAGGDGAIRKAVEFAEDNITQAWEDILVHHPTDLDIVIGIAASGRTPYVIGGLQDAKKNNLLTGSIACNENAIISQHAHHAIEVIVGAEFITGSTRLKAGTAQKLVLNMISTSVMIQLGRIKGNKMVDMQLSNYKLVQRGVNMLVEMLEVSPEQAKNLLAQYGNVRKVLEIYPNNSPK
jgi:N-acetylmuramic acid 6-phosphate etherase